MSETIVDSLSALLADLGQRLKKSTDRAYTEKAKADLVTELDAEIEREIRAVLPTLKPGSSVIGEEDGGTTAEWTWWVDPIDGTTNFIHRWPRSALSVALCHHGKPQIAVVHDPYQEETFSAIAGSGARLFDHRCRVSGCSDLKGALLGTGFAPQPESQWELCRRLQACSHGIRVSGCASLDLCYVACGRSDGFFEVDLKSWDVAAGLLLVREAGGVVTDFKGEPATLDSGNFIATTPGLLPHLVDEIKKVGLEQ